MVPDWLIEQLRCMDKDFDAALRYQHGNVGWHCAGVGLLHARAIQRHFRAALAQALKGADSNEAEEG